MAVLGESKGNECTPAECEVSVVSTGQGRRVRGSQAGPSGQRATSTQTALEPRLTNEPQRDSNISTTVTGSRATKTPVSVRWWLQGSGVRTRCDQEKQQQDKQSQELEKESRKGFYFKEEIDLIMSNC